MYIQSIPTIPDGEWRLVKIFNGQMTSRASPQTKDIRKEEEGVSTSDLGPSEN